MLDEPTAGVDIGAKTEIIQIIRSYADAGKSVILISSELAELMAVCDRIITLFDGRITRRIIPKRNCGGGGITACNPKKLIRQLGLRIFSGIDIWSILYF